MRCSPLDYCQKSSMHSQCRPHRLFRHRSWVVPLTGWSDIGFPCQTQTELPWERGNKGQMAIRRRLDRDSWQGCPLARFPVPLSSNSAFLSFLPFFPRFGRWLCEGLMAASEVRSNLEAWPSTNPEVWTLAKGPRVPIWSLALGGAVLNDREAGKKILLKHSRNVVYFLLGDGKFWYPLVSSPWSQNSTSFSNALVSVGLL